MNHVPATDLAGIQASSSQVSISQLEQVMQAFIEKGWIGIAPTAWEEFYSALYLAPSLQETMQQIAAGSGKIRFSRRESGHEWLNLISEFREAVKRHVQSDDRGTSGYWPTKKMESWREALRTGKLRGPTLRGFLDLHGAEGAATDTYRKYDALLQELFGLYGVFAMSHEGAGTFLYAPTPVGHLFQISDILEDRLNGAKILDLGAGPAFVGLALSYLFNDVQYQGYEFDGRLVRIGNDAIAASGTKNVQLVEDRFENAEFDRHDMFWCYNPLCAKHLEPTEKRIDKLAARKQITIVSISQEDDTWRQPNLMDRFDGNLNDGTRIRIIVSKQRQSGF